MATTAYVAAPLDEPQGDVAANRGPSWCTALGVLLGTFLMTIVGFPISFVVKVGASCVAIVTTTPPAICVALATIWSCRWLGWRRKLLGTVAFPVAAIFACLCEVFGLLFAITISTTVIPYGVAASLLSSPSGMNADIFMLTGTAYCFLMWFVPATICTTHAVLMFPTTWQDFRTDHPQRQESPHDIPGNWDVLCGLLFLPIGFCFAGPLVVALLVVKSPFLLLQVVFRFLKVGCMCAANARTNRAGKFVVIVVIFFGLLMKPFQVVAVCLLLLALALAASALLPAYLAAGWLWIVQRPPVTSGFCNLTLRPLQDGLRGIHAVVWAVDGFTNMVLFWHLPSMTSWDQASSIAGEVLTSVADLKNWRSCLPRPGLANVLRRGGWSPVTGEAMHILGLSDEWAGKLQAAWDNFFEQSSIVGREALARKLLQTSDLESSEPFILLGLPAIVMLRLLSRSQKGHMLQLADETTITAADLCSADRRVLAVWDKLMDAKDALEHAAVDEQEMTILEASVLLGQADHDSITPAGKVALAHMDSLESSRRALLMKVQSGVLNASIDVTKLPMFQSRFLEVLEEMAS